MSFFFPAHPGPPLAQATSRTTGTSSKAMKLLGLSKLPPDASPADHQTLIRQHRSVRKEIAKSASPPGLQRGGSSTKLVPNNQGKSANVVQPEDEPGSLPVTPESRRASMHRDREAGSGDGDGGGGTDGGGRGDRDDLEEIMPHTEWLDMKEFSLKLAPADIDDQFLRVITELMAQFPEPPTRDLAMDLSSPPTVTIGRSKRGDRRGFHAPRLHSQRRGLGVSDRALRPPPTPPTPTQQQQQQRQRHGEHPDQLRQQPLDQHQGDHRGMSDDDFPVRITYSHPDDVFLL